MGIKNLTGKKKDADIADLGPEDVVIIPAFGTEVVDPATDQGPRLPVCGHDLRGRDERLETCPPILQGIGHQHHSRQGLARRDQSHQFPRPAMAAAIISSCSRWRRPITSAITSGTAATNRSSWKSSKAPIRQASIPTCICKPSAWPIKRPCSAAKPKKCNAEFDRRSLIETGRSWLTKNFRFFDTICGATQERQDALRELLKEPMDLLLVIGGYNCSNTSHLAEMGEEKLPTYFVLNASRLVSATEIKHYNLHEKREVVSHFWLPNGPAVIGITAGASCPNNLIEETLIRLFELRGISRRDLELAA